LDPVVLVDCRMYKLSMNTNIYILCYWII